MAPSSVAAAVRVLDQGREVDRAVCDLLTMPDGRTGALHWGLVFPLVDGAIDVAGPSALPAACRPLGRGGPLLPARPELVEGETEAVLLVDGSVVERDEHAARLRAAGLVVLATGARLAVQANEPAWFIRIRRPPHGGTLVDRVTAALETKPAPGPARSPGAEPRLADLANQLDRLRAERAAEQDAVEHERAALVAPVAELERALAAAAATTVPDPAARPAEPPASPPSRVQVRLQDEIATVLAVLASSIELVQDSLPRIVTELADRKALYAALRELDAGGRGMPPGWKRLADAQGWWERHLSTGRDDTGRLYARHDPGRARWSVLVSTKARQKRDIAWLRRCG